MVRKIIEVQKLVATCNVNKTYNGVVDYGGKDFR
jgi:hypothetical protein